MNDPLQFLKKMFALKKGTTAVAGVDIGASSIKIVQLKKEKGRALLQTYGAISLASYAGQDIGRAVPFNEEYIQRAIKDLMQEAQISAGQAVFSIPSSASLVFLVTLPKNVQESDLAVVVPTEARKFIPVPITEVALDWWTLPDSGVVEGNEEGGISDVAKERLVKKQVLVAAIHNEMLAKFKTITSASDMQTSSFEIEMFSNVRSCIGQTLQVTALVDIGATKTKVSIVDRGVIQEFHIITKGSQEMTSALATAKGYTFKKAEEVKRMHGIAFEGVKPQEIEVLEQALQYIALDVRQFILQYEKDRGVAVEQCVLTGGGSLLKGIVAFFEKEIAIKTSRANPFMYTDSPAFISEALGDVGAEFSVAVGLALRALEDAS